MRTVLAVAIAFLCLTLPALGDQTVAGTGNPAMDVANVQKAVDAGGIILLRGNFDFGPGRTGQDHQEHPHPGRKERVRRAEDHDHGRGLDLLLPPARAGFHPFRGPAPSSPCTPSTSTAPRAPRSTSPTPGGWTCAAASSPAQSRRTRPSSGAAATPCPSWPGSWSATGWTTRPSASNAPATGIIRIENNRFEMETDKPGYTAGYGVLADWTSGADIAIRDNVIRRASRNGIEVLDNTLGPKMEGTIRIENNRIVTEDEGVEYPHKYGPQRHRDGLVFRHPWRRGHHPQQPDLPGGQPGGGARGPVQPACCSMPTTWWPPATT